MSDFDKITKEAIHKAAEVSKYMYEELRKIDPVRYEQAIIHGIPHGDLAYGMALVDWIKNGKPKNAWFSYAPGQHECKLLLTFRKEISAHFGLEILTIQEGEDRRQKESKVITKKVVDWGLN